MKNEKIRKSRKKRGMTLAEVIISIAVMAVLALMLTTVGMTIDTYRRDTKERNERIAYEGPAAELQQGDNKHNMSVDDVGKLIKPDFKIVVTPSVSNPVEVDGKLYSTSDQLTGTGVTDNEVDSETEGVEIYDGDTKGHFQFVVVEKPTTPAGP